MIDSVIDSGDADIAVKILASAAYAETEREREALALTRDRRFRIEPKPTQAHVLCTQARAYSRLGETVRACRTNNRFAHDE
jgi:hypothetical protein